jgi:tetratricopeptide (TPR) repeat protein
LLILASCLLAHPAFAGDEPKWVEVHSTHFSVLTDAGEKRGREVALRMEQMRNVFGQLLLKNKLKMSVPLTVVALKSDKQYGLIAPAKHGMEAGLYIPGTDRIYIVLNLFEAEPWRAVAHPLAHYFLNYNYPAAQGWFDEGLAEYFGAMRVTDKQVEIGGDPELTGEWYEDIFDQVRRKPDVPQSLSQLVSSPIWLSMVDLFTMKHDTAGLKEGTHHTLYYAQSWMVIHYLINKNKMPETGTYFDLVLNQKVPVDKAMVQAFDLSPAQMEEAVRGHLNSLSGLGINLDRSKMPGGQVEVPQPYHFAAPFGPDEIGMAVTAVPDADARAVIADVMARVPEHRDRALGDLRQLVADPKGNEPAHRALAWDHLQQKQFDAAADELEKAAELNPRDPWIWYYRSVLKHRKAQNTGQPMQGLANLMMDLRAVLDWYPELAEAYNMLGMARVEGGGTNCALAAQSRISVQPGPDLRGGQEVGPGAGCVHPLEDGSGPAGGSGSQAAVGGLGRAPEVWHPPRACRAGAGCGGGCELPFGGEEPGGRRGFRRNPEAGPGETQRDGSGAVPERQTRRQRLLEGAGCDGHHLGGHEDL